MAIGVAVLVIAALVLAKILQGLKTTPTGYPYQKKKALFTPAERSFLGVLHQAVGDSANIFGKVRVADVVEPKKGMSRSDRQKAFNKISGKHFDFILCRKDDLSIACSIELDDRSHRAKNRQQRDEFLQGVCKAAGIPLIQVPAKSGYAVGEVRQLITPHIGVKEEVERQEAEPEPQKSAAGEKVCPKCGSAMVKRTAKKGKNAGKRFWACSAFPKCRYIEAISPPNTLSEKAI